MFEHKQLITEQHKNVFEGGGKRLVEGGNGGVDGGVFNPGASTTSGGSGGSPAA